MIMPGFVLHYYIICVCVCVCVCLCHITTTYNNSYVSFTFLYNSKYCPYRHLKLPYFSQTQRQSFSPPKHPLTPSMHPGLSVCMCVGRSMTHSQCVMGRCEGKLWDVVARACVYNVLVMSVFQRSPLSVKHQIYTGLQETTSTEPELCKSNKNACKIK